MQQATNLRELKKVFRFSDKYLAKEDANFYVNLYAKEMANLEIDIEDAITNFDTFYITGQSGNGKSTAVNHLKENNDFIKENYDVRHIFAGDIFGYSDEITIIDVLLMIGVTLVEGNKKLEKRYYKELQELKDINVGKLEKSITSESIDESKSSFSAYAKGEIGFLSMFKFGADLKTELKNNEQSRTLLRKLFLPNRREILDIINKIIKDYNLKSENKKLFLILDDLEKKNNISKELFTLHKNLLEKIEVLKIIMIPVNYATTGNVYKLNLRLNTNPLNPTEDDTVTKNNMKILKELVYKRIDKAQHNLMPNTKEIVEKLIQNSGGNIRQLLILISNSARNTIRLKESSISEVDVNEALQDQLNTMAIGIVGRVGFLQHIAKSHIAPDGNNEDKFRESIADNTIFAYFNGQPWYEVNPILKDYIDKIKLS